ncbi:MAG: hypothetical protein RL748_1346, partial [Pseudomonadota bacterium]
MSDCDVIMPDGRWLTLRASLMPQPGETQALHVPEGPHKKRLHGAIWEARMTEPQLISQPAGKRVSLEVCQPRQPQQPEPAPRHTAPGSNGHGDANGKTIPDADASLLAWPAILADRAVRGLWQTTQAKTIALGTSSDWLQGELETSAAQQASLRQLCQVADLGPCELFVPPPVDQAGAALHQQVRAAHPQLILRELENLCCLNGQPQANASVRRAHIWFPVLCGAAEPDRLLSLEIILRRHRYAEGQSDEFIIDGKVTSSQRNEIKTILNSLRQHDQHGVGEWRTLVRMPQDAISGQSYQ